MQLHCSQVQLHCSQVQLDCISCGFAAGFVNLAMKAATKEYTVVSWGEENTLSPDAILS